MRIALATCIYVASVPAALADPGNVLPTGDYACDFGPLEPPILCSMGAPAEGAQRFRSWHNVTRTKRLDGQIAFVRHRYQFTGKLVCAGGGCDESFTAPLATEQGSYRMIVPARTGDVALTITYLPNGWRPFAAGEYRCRGGDDNAAMPCTVHTDDATDRVILDKREGSALRLHATLTPTPAGYRVTGEMTCDGSDCSGPVTGELLPAGSGFYRGMLKPQHGKPTSLLIAPP
jgi:hypothetical protein